MSEDRNSSANSSQQMSRESSNDGLLEVPNRLVCFSNKKNTITTQTRPTQIVKVYSLLKNLILTDFKRLLVYKFSYLPISFCSDECGIRH